LHDSFLLRVVISGQIVWRTAIAQRLPNVSQRLFPAALAKRTIVESLLTSVPATCRRLYQTQTSSMRLFANERLISGIA
jgi:hypothetical protein